MGHSNQIWNFLITDKGIQLINSGSKKQANENKTNELTSIKKNKKTKA
jgi:hypothetical protein